MNHDEELVTEYKTWKNENERINASIINEERKEAHQEGIKEGTLNTKREMVLKMYNKEIPLDIISECTDLSEKEISEIVNN